MGNSEEELGLSKPLIFVPRKFDVSIYLYGCSGSLVAEVRENLMSLVPPNVDISFSSTDAPEGNASDGVEGEYYDNQTMEKVYEVLNAVRSDTYSAEEIVSQLQNRGILFRERV